MNKNINIESNINTSLEKNFNLMNHLYDCIDHCSKFKDDNKLIEYILNYTGKLFGCDRCYIFERSGNRSFSNTFEWCNTGVESQRFQLQDEPAETFLGWFEELKSEKIVISRDVETIRKIFPLGYATVKSQNIKSLISVPLISNDNVVGFLGVDNPDENLMEPACMFIKTMGLYLSNHIDNRKLKKNLLLMSYHDELTGALNRHAFYDAKKNIIINNSLAVVFCDVTGLKVTNDYYGHEAGDKLITHWYNILDDVFSQFNIYRIGGDEFVILCPDIDKRHFSLLINNLSHKIRNDKNNLSVGYSWTDEKNIAIDKLISEADKNMYQDKEAYYNNINNSSESKALGNIRVSSMSNFDSFLKHNYFDINFFLESITSSNTPYYFYVGDMSSNIFYISNNMKEKFAFESNIVYDLLGEWYNRIYTEDEKNLYQKDIESIFNHKKEYHDMKYRVIDKDGNNLWIHCQGRIKWNPEKSKPLLFCGIVSHQEYDFIIDNVTNFPREGAALMKIKQLQLKKVDAYMIAFSFNRFKEINNIFGRTESNTIIKEISFNLRTSFGNNILFYRLDGIRFLALCKITDLSIDETIDQIKHIIDKTYEKYEISLINSSYIGYIKINNKDNPKQLIEKVIGTLEFVKNDSELNSAEYSEHIVQLAKKKSRLSFEIIKDIENDMNNFKILVQPIVSSNDSKIRAGEVLLRWKFEGEYLSPPDFINIVEKNNLMDKLGKWIIDRAFKFTKRVHSFDEKFVISLNISYPQLIEDHFFEYIENKIKEYGINPYTIVVELVETHFDYYPEKLKVFIDKCHSIGIRFSIDDFGVAYSSLSLLMKYSADLVKLDKSLISEASRSTDNEKIIQGIVLLCNNSGKKVCIEGVEDESDLKIAKKIQCDYMQGYYFYRPLEINEFFSEIVNQDEDDK